MLWDLDGTLVDSAPEHWQAWLEVLESRGHRLARAQFDRTFGWRNDAILADWLGEGVAAEERQLIGDLKEARYRELVAAGSLTPLPGAAEWVARLHEAGWRQAIASSAPRANVEAVVAALRFTPFLGGLVGAEDVAEGKPAPDVFLEAARRVGVPAERSIVVEDAAAGIEGARRAGMACIGVGGVAADLTVPSLADLPADAFERLINR